MTRQVTPNALKAIIKHNAVKELKKMNLTKKKYDQMLKKVEKIINDADHEQLKKKGIVKEIVGGMKRGRDDDEIDEPPRRSLLQKLSGLIQGKFIDDDINSAHEIIAEFKRLSEEKHDRKEAYENAKRQTERAKRIEEIKQKEYDLICAQKDSFMNRYQSSFKKNEKLSKLVEQEHEDNLQALNNFDRMIEKGDKSKPVHDNRAKLMRIIQTADDFYFKSTGKHLRDYALHFGNDQSSSSSSSSAQEPAPATALAQASEPQPPPPPPAPAQQQADSSSSSQVQEPQNRQESMEERERRLQQRLQQIKP